MHGKSLTALAVYSTKFVPAHLPLIKCRYCFIGEKFSILLRFLVCQVL